MKLLICPLPIITIYTSSIIKIFHNILYNDRITQNLIRCFEKRDVFSCCFEMNTCVTNKRIYLNLRTTFSFGALYKGRHQPRGWARKFSKFLETCAEPNDKSTAFFLEIRNRALINEIRSAFVVEQM